ncbi:RNA 2'-phosphotransferase [Rothia nasimurium]|uniref:RNA 2'-phosphotransferase n=1 Tax=Rothia nasimurium TaxID=85336 RepID=UPI0015D8C5B8
MITNKLSKLVSYALRHRPEEFNLTPDSQGWVDLDDLVRGIKIIRQITPMSLLRISIKWWKLPTKNGTRFKARKFGLSTGTPQNR